MDIFFQYTSVRNAAATLSATVPFRQQLNEWSLMLFKAQVTEHIFLVTGVRQELINFSIVFEL